MSDFTDIERFGREHAACGGLTPRAAPQAAGGYLLTLTCACGATLERLVTVEDAKRPLPLPPGLVVAPGTGRKTSPAARPAPAPSADLQEALRAALEDEAAARIEPRPSVVVPPPPESQQDLDAITRAALRILDEAGGATTRAAPSPAQRTSPARLNLDTTIRTALTQQAELKATGTAERPRSGGVWRLLLGLVALGATAAIYLVLGFDTLPVAPVGSGSAPARPVSEQQRDARDQIVRSLRQLQAASSPGTTLSVYSNRVIFAKSDVDRFMPSTAPGPVRARLREVLDIHTLAAAAWRARTLDEKEAWETVGQDPAIDLCPSVRRVVDFAAQPTNVSRAQSRGVAVASAIPLLWECAGQKLDALDQSGEER
jgi:hypothetical protein